MLFKLKIFNIWIEIFRENRDRLSFPFRFTAELEHHRKECKESTK